MNVSTKLAAYALVLAAALGGGAAVGAAVGPIEVTDRDDHGGDQAPERREPVPAHRGTHE